MRYFKYDDEYGGMAGVTYIETDNGWTIRQVTFNGSQYEASNIYDPLSGIGMGEGQIAYDELDSDDVTEITSDEFEAVWQTILARHAEIWRHSKARYTPGSTIHGSLLIFYPQGVLVKLDNETVGVAEYAACRASTKQENMSTRHKVTATVKGYDEQHHWIVLDNPHVHDEQVAYSEHFADRR